MKQQFIDLVKSRRFILIVLAALTWVVNQSTIDTNTVLTAITGVLAAATGVGTLDRFGEKVGGK